MKIKVKFIPIILAIGASFAAFQVNAKVENSNVVRVGGYEFPPFVQKDLKSGLTFKLIEELNSHNKKYRFEFVQTTAEKRYQDIATGKFDVIFFEDDAWGWKKQNPPVKKTKVFSEGAEIFVALKKNAKDEAYFANLTGKTIRGITGYHYNVANMQIDKEALSKKQISVTPSHEENLKDLMAGKVDLAIFNTFWIQQLLDSKPELKDVLLVSQKKDQDYRLRGILGAKSKISSIEIENMLSLIDLKAVGLTALPFSK